MLDPQTGAELAQVGVLDELRERVRERPLHLWRELLEIAGEALSLLMCRH